MASTLNNKSYNLASLLVFFISVTLSGCSSTNSPPLLPIIKQSQSERILGLTAMPYWKIKGKIAFLESGSRNSANLVWQINNDQNSQRLNLTSYLGISVLKLESNNNLHTLTVDGNIHKSDDLNGLIYSLTGLTLPTNALQFWLKGLTYQQSDVVIYNDITDLPETLLSQYQSQTWQVKYRDYRQFGQFSLPTKISIYQDALVIKVVINHWFIPAN